MPHVTKESKCDVAQHKNTLKTNPFEISQKDVAQEEPKGFIVDTNEVKGCFANTPKPKDLLNVEEDQSELDASAPACEDVRNDHNPKTEETSKEGMPKEAETTFLRLSAVNVPAA